MLIARLMSVLSVERRRQRNVLLLQFPHISIDLGLLKDIGE
jgi:hypothetical protein